MSCLRSFFLYLAWTASASFLTVASLTSAAEPAAPQPPSPNTALAPSPPPPAPPGSVESTPLSPTAIRLYWSAPPGAVSGYRVLRDGRPVAELAPETRAFDDLDLRPGQNYHYRVVALQKDTEPAPAAVPPVPASGAAPAPMRENGATGGVSPAPPLPGNPASLRESPPSVEIVERPEPEWPEQMRADVLVIGASSAGVGAAVAAARLRSRVVLLEETTRVGGMVSNGLCSTDLRDVRRASGIFAEFLGRVRAHYGSGDGRRFEPHVANDEMKAILYAEPRITFFPRVRVERVLLRDRRVIGVVARHLGTGQQATFLAAQTIDATAEGDIAAGAGCRFRVGRERRTRREPHAGVIHYYRAEDRLLPGSTGRGDRRIMSYAYLIIVKDYGPGTDHTIPMPPGYDSKNYDHTLPWPQTWATTSGRLPNGKFEINEHPQGSDLQGINYDYPNASPERRAQIAEQYRNHVLGFLYYLQTVRGLKNLGLADDEFRDTDNFPPTLYVREARRIQGLVTLHEDEVTDARQQVQRRSVGIGDYPMDSHAVRSKTDWKSPDMGEGEFWLVKYTPWYQIPYGVLVPRDVDGLLVPMACSATHVGYGTLRMEPVRMALGQAAGTAAHFCAELGVEPRELPARFLQDKLPAQGLEVTFLPDVSPATRHYGAIQFLGAQGFFADGPLQPDAPTTRAEAARWLSRLRILDFGFWIAGKGKGLALSDLGLAGPVQNPNAQTRGPAPRSAPPPEIQNPEGAPATRAELARWLVRAKGWPLVHPSSLRYADVPPDSPDAPYIETLAAHRVDSRLWADPPASPAAVHGEQGSEVSPPQTERQTAIQNPKSKIQNPLFHPEAPLSHADFAEALFLAARDLSPLFAELPGPAVWKPGSGNAGAR